MALVEEERQQGRVMIGKQFDDIILKQVTCICRDSAILMHSVRLSDDV